MEAILPASLDGEGDFFDESRDLLRPGRLAWDINLLNSDRLGIHLLFNVIESVGTSHVPTPGCIYITSKKY
jgi:hypothetical protein